MSNFEEMMKEYENSKNQTNSNSKQKEYKLDNYFSTWIPQTESSAEKQIRILPIDGQNKFWVEFYGHKAQVDGAWKTFPCLDKEEESECPFCQARDIFLKRYREAKDAGDTTLADMNKELAKKFSVRKMYILKVIERGKEDEGVKFWRFNHAYDKGGTLDKIMNAIKVVKHDVTDPETGRDLIINISRNQMKIPVVQSIAYPLESTKLSDDESQANEWLGDTRTWRDVYSLRNYDYLGIVVRGYTPVWSKEQEKFVAKEKLEAENETPSSKTEDPSSEIEMGFKKEESVQAVPVVDTTQSTVKVTEEEEEDDLPF
jgi:hypothetical protein|tara:strand:+ start:735 stop:1679 length:945 start_codon:yes stop_codon:yes gene_type:complete